MKKFVLFVSVVILCSLTGVQAQDKWQVLLNNRTIAKGTVEEGREAIVKRHKLPEADKYTVIYNTENSDNEWNRTFYIEDEKGQLLKTIRINRQSGGFYIRPTFINPVMQEKKTLVIYTVSLPKDSALAATAKPRRVQLAKLIWR